jgi:hypothetical protein
MVSYFNGFEYFLHSLFYRLVSNQSTPKRKENRCTVTEIVVTKSNNKVTIAIVVHVNKIVFYSVAHLVEKSSSYFTTIRLPVTCRVVLCNVFTRFRLLLKGNIDITS